MRLEVIAEIGSNFLLGNAELGKKLIFECEKAGASSVKFQMWHPKELYSENHPYWDVIKKSELTFEKASVLKAYADKLGIEWFCSVFYPEAVDLLEKLGVKRYKIASRTAAHKDPQEVMRKISKTGKPVVISTGTGYNPMEITELFGARYKLLYCIPRYPASLEDLKLREIKSADGYSNHIPDPLPCLVTAIWRGSQDFIVETHVMLDETFRDKSPDGCCSITVNELAWLVENIRKVELMLG